MSKAVIRTIRALGTVILLWGVYSETGVWTTTALALTVVSLELQAWGFGVALAGIGALVNGLGERR